MEREFNYGVEVELTGKFSIVRETLERIGIANTRKKTLTPSCYCLHKKGKYFILHFKELLMLDGNQSNYSVEDGKRRNAIVDLLEKWNLVKVIDPTKIEDKLKYVYVLPYKERDNYNIVHKYHIGVRKTKKAKDE
jgi:hypothetical protein